MYFILAVLHLYYARFLSHFLYSLGLVPQREPFNRLLVQGMIMGQSYRIKGSGKYLPKSQVNIIGKQFLTIFFLKLRLSICFITKYR